MVYNLLMQTTRNPQTVPNHIQESWDITFSGKRLIYNDNDCKRFLKTYFGSTYVSKFNSFTSSCFKADLFRYAWLYIHGGIYIDIKTTLVQHVNDIFPDENVMYIIYTANATEPAYNKRIFNGIIATPAKNPIMLKLLNGVMNFEENIYCQVCMDGYKTLVDIYKDIVNDDKGIIIGRHLSPDKCLYPDMHVYHEYINTHNDSIIQGPSDRYGSRCQIYNEKNEHIINVRCPHYGITWGP